MHRSSPKIFSPQNFRFILSCINGVIEPDQLNRLTEQDWSLINQVAKEATVSSLIFYRFKQKNCLDLLPPTIRDNWGQHFYNNLKRNEAILQNLFRVLNQFKAADLEVILLKGMSLLVDIYPNLGLRHMSDIDILVKPEYTRRLIEILQDLGFDLIRPNPQALMAKFDTELQFSGEGFSKPGFSQEGAFFLEVFTGFHQYERFKGIIWNQLDRVWNRSQIINFQDTQVRVLSPLDQILHLSSHLGLVHLFSSLALVYDINAIIQRYKQQLDWRRLLNEARKQRLSVCVYYTLLLIQRFFSPDIPDWLIKELRPSWLKRIIINLLIDKDCIRHPDEMPRIRRYLLQILLMDKVWDSFRVIFKGLFPSREWFLYRYGNKVLKKIYIYRLLHPFKILFR